MSPTDDTLASDQVRFGPIMTIEVHLGPVPAGRPVVESVGNDTVPFDQVRHLIAARPISPPRRDPS